MILLDRLLFPCERFGDLAVAEASDVELRRRSPAQVVKMQIAICHPGVDLGFVERTAKTLGRPRSMPAASQDGCGHFGICARTSRRAPYKGMIASRRCRLLPVPSTMASSPICGRPTRNRYSAASPLAGEFDGVGDLGRTSLLDLRNVGVSPDDLGAIIAVEVLNALAGIAGYTAKFDAMGHGA